MDFTLSNANRFYSSMGNPPGYSFNFGNMRVGACYSPYIFNDLGYFFGNNKGRDNKFISLEQGNKGRS